MLEALSMPFMQRAAAGGLLVALVTGYYGPFIVQRQLAFLGNGLAHAAFGGVAIGILSGAQPLWVALPFTAAVAAAIVWLQARTRLAADTAIGVMFALAMAVGIIALSRTENYTRDAFQYLFGSLLAVTWWDVAATGVVLAVTAASLPRWSHWAYATFDRDLARADRAPVQRDDYLLAIGVAVAVVASIKVVGIVLAAAFLVIPAAAARLLAGTFARMALYTVGISVGSVAAGLVLAWYGDLPAGPSIILVQAGLFSVSVLRPRSGIS